jgi:hypothetical protein
MSNEEMERAIEFLLQSQAKTNEQVEVLARTHVEFAGFVRSNLEALNEVSRELRETVRALTISQARTDARLSEIEGQG